jgi:Mg2+-importing ATPase
MAGDNVDPEWVRRPHKWDSRFLTRWMIVFGTVSSVFDLLTFAILLLVFRAGKTEFRTGWFMESLLTELVIALVVRTRRPFYRSRPGAMLLLSSLAIIAITALLSQIPLGSRFGFVPLPFSLWLAVAGLTILYVIGTELTKSAFYARFPQDLEIKVP